MFDLPLLLVWSGSPAAGLPTAADSLQLRSALIHIESSGRSLWSCEATERWCHLPPSVQMGKGTFRIKAQARASSRSLSARLRYFALASHNENEHSSDMHSDVRERLPKHKILENWL